MDIQMFSVTATCGRPRLLRRMLASLAACEKPPGYQGAIVVENGPSAPETTAALRDYSDALAIQYYHRPQANGGAAYNLVLERTPGDFLFYFHDDDVRLSPHALSAMAGAARTAPRSSFFGGPLAIDYEREPPEWLKPLLPFSAAGFELEREVVAPYDQVTIIGPNWGAYAADLRDIGGFETAIGPGRPSAGMESAAVELLLQRGLTAYYVPGARAWHYVPAERCSPAWAVRRQYRTNQFYGRQPIVLKRAPRRFIGSAAAFGVYASKALFFALSRDEARCVAAACSARARLGYLVGSFKTAGRFLRSRRRQWMARCFGRPPAADR